MIKTAVIGHGFSAKTFHLPFLTILADFQISAISSSQGDAVAVNYPDATVYPTAEDLILNSDAELVIITSPNVTHFPLAKLALQQQKHVLLEKPFVTTVAEGEELIALAEQQDRLLTVYQNRRWDSDFLTLKMLIESGKLGEIRYFSSHFDRFRPNKRDRWRELPGAGTGIWYDLGPHLVDQTLCLFGMPQSLTGRCLAMPGTALMPYCAAGPKPHCSIISAALAADFSAVSTNAGLTGMAAAVPIPLRLVTFSGVCLASSNAVKKPCE